MKRSKQRTRSSFPWGSVLSKHKTTRTKALSHQQDAKSAPRFLPAVPAQAPLYLLSSTRSLSTAALNKLRGCCWREEQNPPRIPNYSQDFEGVSQSECNGRRLSHRRANKRNEKSSRNWCTRSASCSDASQTHKSFPHTLDRPVPRCRRNHLKTGPRSGCGEDHARSFWSCARFKCAHIASGNCIVCKTQSREGPRLFPIMPRPVVETDSRCGTGPSTFQIYYNSYWCKLASAQTCDASYVPKRLFVESVFFCRVRAAREGSSLSLRAVTLLKWDIWISKGKRSRWLRGAQDVARDIIAGCTKI